MLRACRGHHRRDSKISLASRLDCHQPGIVIYLKVLVIAMLLPRHLAKILYRFPLPDGRADQKAE